MPIVCNFIINCPLVNFVGFLKAIFMQNISGRLHLLLAVYNTEAHLEPSRIPKVKRFVKIVSGFQPITIFAKSFILNGRLGFGHISVTANNVIRNNIVTFIQQTQRRLHKFNNPLFQFRRKGKRKPKGKKLNYEPNNHRGLRFSSFQLAYYIYNYFSTLLISYTFRMTPFLPKMVQSTDTFSCQSNHQKCNTGVIKTSRPLFRLG